MLVSTGHTRGFYKAYPFNRLPFVLCDAYSLGSRWQWRILICILTQQLKKLVGMLSNQLSKLGVPSADLLEDGFEHARLGLYNLSELLELGIVSEEVQIVKSARSPSGTGASSGSHQSF